MQLAKEEPCLARRASSEAVEALEAQAGRLSNCVLERGLCDKTWLTFKDLAVEAEYLRNQDDRNWRPTIRGLSVALALQFVYIMTVASYRTIDSPDQRHFRAFLLCSNILGAMCAGIPLAFVWRRWCTCEKAVLTAMVSISGNFFTSSAYFMAKFFSISDDFVWNFHQNGPLLLLALVMINSCANEGFFFRSSRCCILPVCQVFFIAAMYFPLAPLPAKHTAMICAVYLAGAYLSWRGRRLGELRMRSDYLENRELHLAIDREVASSRLHQQRLQEIEDRLKAMDAWVGRSGRDSTSSSEASGGTPPARQVLIPCKDDRIVPRPPRCSEPDFECQFTSSQDDRAGANAAEPNQLLHSAMAGRKADAARVRRMAERIRSSEYCIRAFFEDAVAAFPELELFFVTATNGNSHVRSKQRTKGELEYQRTICALFSVYWLLRLDGDGKQGFCFGVHGWDEDSTGDTALCLVDAGVDIHHCAKRGEFLESADWAKMEEMATSSMGGDGKLFEIERVEAMLCLTAIHDILKMEWLCPQVSEEHGPYKGYAAGIVIHDHDIALAYVMEHYPELLPSYGILSPRMRELLLFTQSKMQFNHGWFVQAEAPPGLMLSSLKGCLAAAQPGDLPFYFFHWITDLSGAEGTPKGGAEKLVLKFPEPVLAAFLWSIPFLEGLVEKTETEVTEQYLVARWRSQFPDVTLPSGASSVALLRLAVMAQAGSWAVAEAFASLHSAVRDLLSKELARTGCPEQDFEECCACGGPALLIYYGPALLQHCHGVEEMRMGLHILAATMAAGRGLWPLHIESQGNTVLIDIAQLRTYDIRSVVGGAAVAQSSTWVLLPKNHREAALELLETGEINSLNLRGIRYWVLDLRLDEEKVFAISC